MNKLVLPVSDDALSQAQSERGWTALRLEVALKLFDSGLSDAQCACLIGGVTRNAVIGMRHRQGIHVGTAVDRPRLKNANRIPAGEPREVRLARRIPKPKQFAPRIERPADIDDLSIPAGQRRSLVQLNDACCRWPVGDPSEPDFFFCGNVVREPPEGVRRSPYCPSHTWRAQDHTRRARSADTLVPKLASASINHDFRR